MAGVVMVDAVRERERERELHFNKKSEALKKSQTTPIGEINKKNDKEIKTIYLGNNNKNYARDG